MGHSRAATTATISFFNAALEAIYLLYMTRNLALSSGLIGLIFSAGSLGFLVGALLPTPVVQRFGLGPTMTVRLLILTLSDFTTIGDNQNFLQTEQILHTDRKNH